MKEHFTGWAETTIDFEGTINDLKFHAKGSPTKINVTIPSDLSKNFAIGSSKPTLNKEIAILYINEVISSKVGFGSYVDVGEEP